MCFKTPVCSVLWIAITVIMNSATAEHETFAIVIHKIEKFEQNIVDKLQTLYELVKQAKTDASEFHHDSISIEALASNIIEKLEVTIMRKLVTHLEQHSNHVIAKLAALTTKVQQMADSNQNLRIITDNLLVGQREQREKQLISVKDDLQSHRSHVEQVKANETEYHKLQNSTNAQHEEVIVKLSPLTTNVQQMADSNQNLRNITDKIVVSLSGVEKQLNVSYETNTWMNPSSCTTLNINVTGTYSIRFFGVAENFLAFCDFENYYNLGGGWTVFQRRIDGGVNFFQNWTMYKNGFGDVNGEHWLGLEKLHLMTRWARHELLVILEDHEGGSAYALYDSFQIGSEAQKYNLTIGKYSGTAGEDALSYHNGMKFSTFDQDNDKSDDINCAENRYGAWWFSNCANCHLNGKYRRKGEHLNTDYQGVLWYQWKGYGYSLKSTKMMLRRRSG
uniref:Fibrinogen C-terminal domain-containing protein n=2 Tax=Anopheles atroparvus TaxID=41427 RepID=A0AAG5DKA9_ANOAO